MRGDRPGYLPIESYYALVPRMRGDRPLVCRTGAALLGFPACAGIDPVAFCCHCTCWWFPRMRGDRPAAEVGLRHQRHNGSPACAGIDPCEDALRKRPEKWSVPPHGAGIDRFCALMLAS